MEEILIEDKKYVSTKQAAKLTGYAKDYVGQLCREGRVPARLVGRSWYVLASAIQDHRFADKQEAAPLTLKAEDSSPAALNFPRYEAYQAAPLPTLNRLEVPEKPRQGTLERKDIAPPDLRDSWNQWFEKNEQTHDGEIVTVNKTLDAEIDDQKTNTNAAVPEEEAVKVPLHVVSQALPHKELLPTRLPLNESVEAREAYSERVMRGNGSMWRSTRRVALYAVGIAALMFATFAVISTGFFDKYLISFKQASLITGIHMYKK